MNDLRQRRNLNRRPNPLRLGDTKVWSRKKGYRFRRVKNRTGKGKKSDNQNRYLTDNYL